MNQLSAFGAFCDPVDTALQELQNVLAAAHTASLDSDPTVVSAQAVYDAKSGFAVYVNFLGDSCDKDAAEINAAAERVRSLLANGGITVPKLRPDYVPPEQGLSMTVKVIGGIAAGVVGLIAVAYITGQTASMVKLFKGSKRVSGYRRSRRHR